MRFQQAHVSLDVKKDMKHFNFWKDLKMFNFHDTTVVLQHIINSVN